MRSAGGASGALVLDLDANGDGDAVRQRRRSPPGAGLEREAVHDRRLPRRARPRRAAADPRLRPRRAVRAIALDPGRRPRVVGDGDPAFGTARFARADDQPVTRVADLARDVARAGVKRVTGRVLADDSIFDRKRARRARPEPALGALVQRRLRRRRLRPRPRVGRGAGDEEGAAKARRPGRRAGRPHEPPRLRPRPQAARLGRLAERRDADRGDQRALEQLLRRDAAASRLAAEDGSRGTRLARRRRRGAVRQVGRAPSIQAVDGSGLSRRNSVSPQEVVKLLVAMDRDRTTAPRSRARCRSPGARARSRTACAAPPPRATARPRRAPSTASRRSPATATPAGTRSPSRCSTTASTSNAARVAQDAIAAAIARYNP